MTFTLPTLSILDKLSSALDMHIKDYDFLGLFPHYTGSYMSQIMKFLLDWSLVNLISKTWRKKLKPFKYKYTCVDDLPVAHWMQNQTLK